MKKSSVPLACAVGALILVLSGCGGGSTGNSGTANSASPSTSQGSSSVGTNATVESSEAADGESSFVNGVLTTPDVRIEIVKHKVIPVGKKGNEYGKKPVIAFWYKTTNLSGKKADPMEFILNITAYQDNNPNSENKLNVGGLPDDRFLDTQMETIKKGGTVENAVAYELDDLTTPVDLVAAADLGMTELGKVTYQLK
jgi:hypothetical protein